MEKVKEAKIKETHKEKKERKKAEKAERKRVVNVNFIDMYKVTWKTVFGNGFKSWLVLAVVAVFFSIISFRYSISGNILDEGDSLLGLVNNVSEDNEAILRNYIEGTKIGGVLNEMEPGISDFIISVISEKAGLIVQVLCKNAEYVKRNSGEVFVFSIIVSVLVTLISFLLRSVSDVGQVRFITENRYQKVARFRRLLAPYGKGQFFHIFWIYIRYQLSLFLWSITVIGYFVKAYQYKMVPYLLAENPTLTWKQVKKISSQMTKGYKFKMFLMEITIIPIWLLQMVVIVGSLIGIPFIMQLDAEWYARLRRRQDIDRSAFIEPIFDGDAYVVTHTEKKEMKALIKQAETKEEKAALRKELRAKTKEDNKVYHEYVMPDILIEVTNFDEADKYKVTDFIVMFFAFCLVGWLWEVGLHVVRDHAFVNRGMMYGPWIPIYGFGGVFIIFFLNRFKNNKIKLIIFTMILCGILEYLTSFVLDYAMNASYWDYKDLSFNLNGRICLAGLAAFAAGGFAGIYVIGPAIKGKLEKFGKKRTVILCTVLVVAFLIDFICCQIFGSNSGAGVGGTI